MVASILPSLNLHWLPSVIANPNLTINPAQISTIGSKLAVTAPVVPSVAATPAGIPIQNTAISGPVLSLPSGAVITSAGGIYQTPVGSLGGPATPVSPVLRSVPITPTGQIAVPQIVSTIQLKPSESAHFESEVPGGSESEPTKKEMLTEASIIAPAAATVIPGIRVPTPGDLNSIPSTNVSNYIPTPTEYASIIASLPTISHKKEMQEKYKSEDEIAEDKYIKEIEEVISPKGIIFNITIHTVILSAFIFICLLAWFEVLRTWYDQTFDPTLGVRNVNMIFVRFWYAVFITCLIIIFVYILHRWSKSR